MGKHVKLGPVTSKVVEFPEEDYKHGINAEGRRPHREKLQKAPFVAWDGEGYTDDTGQHHYMMFGNSNGDSVKGTSLTWRECFPLLLQSGDSNNVIYGGDYDIIMMTRDMPYVVRERLYKGLPVKYGGYRMRYMRRKMFYLSDLRTNKRVVLYDVLSFFQTTFVNACKEYLGDDETLQAMHQMKLKRDAFNLGDESVIPYWQSELDYLVRLANTLRELLLAVDIKPRGWYGPGAVASALLNSHHMKHYYGSQPDEIIDIAERAYYGGRFEQFRVGKLDNVYEYDIRSAYPHAIAQLPDFSYAHWQHATHEAGDRVPVDIFGLYNVSWRVGPLDIGPFPWRRADGRIYYPRFGHASWYWGIEVRECLQKSFPPRMYTINESWVPNLPEDTEQPFRSWVPQMYKDRARMKREGNPAQKALKLGLNSLYGKLAQSTGTQIDKDGTYKKPPWHHILWAGWITASTRARLFNAIRKHRTSVIAMETDAIFTTKPIPELKCSERLGDWEETHFEQVLYVQSGVYYALTEDGVWRLKSRGLEVDKTKSANYWLETFKRLPHEVVTITNKMRRFGTDIRMRDTFGRWYDYETSTTMPMTSSKRMHGHCLVCLVYAKSERPIPSYAECSHLLMVPQGSIDSDIMPSTPYGFIWRNDANYEWPSVIRSEVIELPEDLAFEWEDK